jgi:hypothetical protein
MTFLLSFLIGNPLGRTLAKAGLILTLVGIAVLMIYKKGRNDQSLSRMLATVKALKERIDVDTEVRHMDINDRRDALRKWVR